MDGQKLFVEMTIRDGNNYITARCPNEDDEMCITVKNKYKVNHMLTLQEAEDLADFLIEHVKNARLSNGDASADSSHENSGLNIADVNGSAFTTDDMRHAFCAGEEFANECKCGECHYCTEIKVEDALDFEDWIKHYR